MKTEVSIAGEAPMLKKFARIGFYLGIVLIGLFLFIQALPLYSLTNPPVIQEPAWNNTETRSLAKRACFDCHSNETVWPWYARIAPVKWLVVNDVNAGRATYNFSDWHSNDMDGAEAAEVISEGRMPLPQYLLLHPSAHLTEAEKQTLINGLLLTMK